MLLTWLTVIVAGALVLTLAVYLTLIAVALTLTWRDVARIADAFERTAAGIAPLGDKVALADAAMRQLAEGMAGLGDRLAAALAAGRR